MSVISKPFNCLYGTNLYHLKGNTKKKKKNSNKDHTRASQIVVQIAIPSNDIRDGLARPWPRQIQAPRPFRRHLPPPLFCLSVYGLQGLGQRSVSQSVSQSVYSATLHLSGSHYLYQQNLQWRGFAATVPHLLFSQST